VGDCPTWAVRMVKHDTGEVIWDGRGVIRDWVSDKEGY
jgi:PBP1b-binding outer membrane lipoprotein LpoB